MIVPMKKISLVVRSSWKNDLLKELSKVEVLHVQNTKEPSSRDIDDLKYKIDSLERALLVLNGANKSIAVINEDESKNGIEIAKEILQLEERRNSLKEDIATLEEESVKASVWGRTDPHDLLLLENKGIYVKLYSCRRHDLEKITSIDYNIVHHHKATLYISVISTNKTNNIGLDEVDIPAHGIEELENKIESENKELSLVENRISELVDFRKLIESDLQQHVDLKIFEETKAGMGGDKDVAFLTGFIPKEKVVSFEKLASNNNWAIMVEEPLEDDEVPTLVKSSKISRLFQPVMNFIGVVPGYNEYDTNMVFLLFFVLFFAMIVGDGGYGLFFLILTFAATKIGKGISPVLKILFYSLSSATVVWGAVTGNWFGIESAATWPIIGSLIIPSLDSFVKENDAFIIHLCFLIALTHLTIAHLWKAIRKMPSLLFLAEIGWLGMVWSIFFFAEFLILKEPLGNIALYLLVGGFALIVIFAKQESDGFFKGLLRGLLSSPLTMLDGMGSFSHLVSYIRLFAVGLATKEVAVAFNGLAESVGYLSTVSILGAVIILIIGHGMNILLAAMAVLVHAVRLNLLEFSGHMDIQWSGVLYKPFKVKIKNL